MPLNYNLIAQNRPQVSENEVRLGEQLLEYGSSDNLFDATNSFVSFFYSVSIVLIITFIAISGVKFLTAAGDKTKAESAKKSLTYAIWALVLLLALGLIINNLIPNLFFGAERDISAIERTSIN